MNTIQLNENVTNAVSKHLTKRNAEEIAVRAASPNQRTGRCLFDFDHVGTAKVMIAVVVKGAEPTGEYYVIPRRLCPSKLLLRPGSASSKWFPYLCDDKNLRQRIESTLDYKQSRKLSELLERLG